jgi:hypothetical protein
VHCEEGHHLSNIPTAWKWDADAFMNDTKSRANGSSLRIAPCSRFDAEVAAAVAGVAVTDAIGRVEILWRDCTGLADEVASVESEAVCLRQWLCRAVEDKWNEESGVVVVVVIIGILAVVVVVTVAIAGVVVIDEDTRPTPIKRLINYNNNSHSIHIKCQSGNW